MTADEQILAAVLDMGGQLATLAETTRRIEIQTTATNGRVTALEDWRDTHDHRMEVDDAVEAGAATVRASDLAKLRSLREFILDDALRLGLVAVGGAIAGVLWRWPL